MPIGKVLYKEHQLKIRKLSVFGEMFFDAFYYLFQAMENFGILDRKNHLHMFVLHFVFLERINKAIETFTSGWNHHPLRTEHNLSPVVIWQHGSMIDVRNRNLNTVHSLTEVSEHPLDDLWYGYDPNVPFVNNAIKVNEIAIEDFNDFEELRLFHLQHIAPLQQ